MNKEEFCFKIRSGTIVSNSFKKNFLEDIHTKLEAKKSQKLVNRNTIENFVPILKPKKTTRIPSPLKLNNNIKANENNDDTEILSEKENSSFIDDSDIYSSSSEEDAIFKNEKGELKNGFSSNDSISDRNQNDLIKDEDVSEKCNKSKKDNCIKNTRIKMCNIKNSINVNNIQKSSTNNVKIKNKYYMTFLQEKDNVNSGGENLNSRIESRNHNKKASILDVLIHIRGN